VLRFGLFELRGAEHFLKLLAAPTGSKNELKLASLLVAVRKSSQLAFAALRALGQVADRVAVGVVPCATRGAL